MSTRFLDVHKMSIFEFSGDEVDDDDDDVSENLEDEELQEENDDDPEELSRLDAEEEEQEVVEEENQEDRVLKFRIGKRKDRDTVGPRKDDSISATLTDPDVLDCPVCVEPLTIPVFQCENGHTACFSCCSKLRNKCSS